MAQNTTIRRTDKYELYQGYGRTANLYNVLQLPKGYGEHLQSSKNWMNEMQKDEIVALPDETFNQACSKLEYS